MHGFCVRAMCLHRFAKPAGRLFLHSDAGLRVACTNSDRLILWFGHAKQGLAVLALHKLSPNFVGDSQYLAATKIRAD